MFKQQQSNSFHTGELSYSPTIGETQIANVNFKLISLNARGIRDFQKRKAIFSWIKKQNADIAFLQETHSTPEIVDAWKFQWHENIYYSHGTNHIKGVLILVSDKLQFELRSVSQDSDGSPFLLLNNILQTKHRNNVRSLQIFYQYLMRQILIQVVSLLLEVILMQFGC